MSLLRQCDVNVLRTHWPVQTYAHVFRQLGQLEGSVSRSLGLQPLTMQSMATTEPLPPQETDNNFLTFSRGVYNWLKNREKNIEVVNSVPDSYSVHTMCLRNPQTHSWQSCLELDKAGNHCFKNVLYFKRLLYVLYVNT